MKNLIVVDMQKGFINEHNKHLVDKINKYLSANEFENIFLTQCVNNNQSPYIKILNWNGMLSAEEQMFAINIPKQAKVITKNCYGVSQKDIEMFKNLEIGEMEICGTDIDACVLAIGFNLFDNNIKPIFIKDLCATSSSNENLTSYAYSIIERQFGIDSIK